MVPDGKLPRWMMVCIVLWMSGLSSLMGRVMRSPLSSLLMVSDERLYILFSRTMRHLEYVLRLESNCWVMMVHACSGMEYR